MADEHYLPDFEHPQVQAIYELLCSDEHPPNPEEHWEGWMARRIVALFLSDLEAMRSVYREKNPCGHYKRFQIVDTDPESACAACEIDRICGEYEGLEKQLEAMRAERNDTRSLLASVTDLLNSWARESYTPEADRPEEIKSLIDRLWAYWSAEIARLRGHLNLADEARLAMVRAASESAKECDEMQDELDRLRKALEEIASGKHGVFGAMVVANRALNPQAPSTEQNKPLARIPTPNVDAMFERAAQLADELVPDEEE